MADIEVVAVFHEGWSDPEWVKGFLAIVEPRIWIDPSKVAVVMADPELQDAEPLAEPFTFEETLVAQSNGVTIVYGGNEKQHYGMLGSSMNKIARESFETRLGFLLRSEGIEPPA